MKKRFLSILTNCRRRRGGWWRRRKSGRRRRGKRRRKKRKKKNKEKKKSVHCSLIWLLGTARFARACAPLCSFICSFAHSLNPELMGMLMIRCLNDLVLSHNSMVHFLSNVKHVGKIILFKLKKYDQSPCPLAIAGRVGATFLARRTFSFHLFESAVKPLHIG